MKCVAKSKKLIKNCLDSQHNINFPKQIQNDYIRFKNLQKVYTNDTLAKRPSICC